MERFFKRKYSIITIILFGWCECEYHDWLIDKGYSYIVEINLRQQKLLKWKT